MKRFFYIFSLVLITAYPVLSQSAEELLMRSEADARMLREAYSEAAKSDLPKSIYLPEGIFIDLRGVINSKPAYVVMYNLLNPYEKCEIMNWDQITSGFDLSSAKMIYTDGRTVNENLGYPAPVNKRTTRFLLFMESGIARVSALDAMTGDVLILNYLTDATLSTPKQARIAPWGFISISDQVLDVVRRYDTLGVYQGVFAPAGGVNNNILDNIRGHNYKNGFLFVTNAGGTANLNCVAKFDSAGNYINNFIANGAGGIGSPYDILFRQNDVLVAAYTNKAVFRYDLAGNFLDVFADTINFPQQTIEAPNGNILVADFGVNGGLRIYSSTGDSIAKFNVITANRGAWQLGNGNYLTTNAAGLHELSSTGSLVRTIISGVAGQFISPYDLEVIPVELVSFNAVSEGSNVVLKWTTATETNNAGFTIERSPDNISFKKIGFVKGSGNSTENISYRFTDKNPGSGKFYYRLKQTDLNGTFSYSDVSNVEIALPSEFVLEQNYPNPFNPVTEIRFTIPADSWVRAEIFNAIGQKVAELHNGFMKAGTHSFSFDASSLNSGIYYYKVSAGNSVSVKKMILMK